MSLLLALMTTVGRLETPLQHHIHGTGAVTV
jgi:hypothetical protein